MDKKINPVASCADTIMRHGLVPVKAVSFVKEIPPLALVCSHRDLCEFNSFYVQSFGRIKRG